MKTPFFFYYENAIIMLEVKKMKIENERYLVEFTTAGGEMTQFLDKKTGIQYLYQGDSNYWSGKNPTLFPIVGNTYDGTYEAKGNTYQFKNHGLIRYATLECTNQSDHSITFALSSNEDTLKVYPYRFLYEITYTLINNRLEIVYHIHNHDEETMPFTFGLHPGFKVPLLEGESYEDYTVTFECEEKMEQLIADAKKVIPHYYEPITMKELHLDYELMKKYATLIYRGYSSSYVTLQGKSEHKVRVSIAGYPLLALWSPINAPFLCIEPWYSHADFEKVDCPFADRYGMMKLEPQQIFTTSYTIEVE